MKVLIVSNGDDMAGIGYYIKDAFDRFGKGFEVRQIRGTDNYIRYPADRHAPPFHEVRTLYDASDLIHLMEYPWALAQFGINEPLNKPAVVHQHGSPYRSDSGSIRNNALKMPILVSTPDLIIHGDEIWLPNPISVADMKAIRKERYVKSKQVRLGHFPTNPAIKHTAEYATACVNLSAKYDIDYLTGTYLSHEQTLAEKARCDILYDQMTYGYGLNGIEAGAMGLAVVGGFEDPAVRERFLGLTGGDSPLVESTPDTLEDVLRGLVTDKKRMKEEQRKAHAFVKRFHDYPVVVKKLSLIWEKTYDEVSR